MFVEHEFAEPPQPQDILEPKNQNTYLKVWRDLGPVAIADVSEELKSYTWELQWMEGDWVIYRMDDPDNTVEVLVDSGLTEEPLLADVTFDNAGRPFVAWETEDGIQIYWYDPTIPGYTISNRAEGGKNPFCHLDYRVRQQQNQADIILCYERDNAVYYRITSDRYTEEYSTPITDLGNRRIMRAGVGTELRYTIWVA